MADAPDVLKRLEEIEARGVDPRWDLVQQDDLRWLMRLTRALLESQGELMETMPANCRLGPECPYCRDMVVRAERVRRGEV